MIPKRHTHYIKLIVDVVEHDEFPFHVQAQTAGVGASGGGRTLMEATSIAIDGCIAQAVRRNPLLLQVIFSEAGS